MRTEKYGAVLLTFIGCVWCRQSDEDHIRGVQVNYGGWRPIRGKNLYARNLNDSKSDPSQRNLYVVVPSELINTVSDPPTDNSKQEEEYQVSESRIKQQRALDADPFPVSEPITDLRTFISGKTKSGDHLVQESQQREVFQQAIYPVKGDKPNGDSQILNHPGNQKDEAQPTFEISHQGVLQLKPIGIIPHFPNTGHFQPAETINNQENNLHGLRGFNSHIKQETRELIQEQHLHPNYHKNSHQFGLRIRNQDQKLVEQKFKEQQIGENEEIIPSNIKGYENAENIENRPVIHSEENRVPPKLFRPLIHPIEINNQFIQSSGGNHQPSIIYQKTLTSQLHFGENPEFKDHYEKGETRFTSQIDKTANLNLPHPSLRPYPPRDTYFPPLITSNINPEQNNDIPQHSQFRPSAGPIIHHPVRLKFTASPNSEHHSVLNCVTEIVEDDHIQENSLEEVFNRYNAYLLFQHVPLSLNGLLRLSSAGGPYTLFIPSNEVVSRLPQPLLKKWKRNPQALMFILLNHAVHGRNTLADLRQKKILESKSNGALLFINDHRNETVTVNGRRVMSADIPGPQGGIIHVIDGILHPTADKDIIDTVRNCDRFDGFLHLADVADISGYLRGAGPFTLFLPSNDALMKIEKEDMDILKSNVTALREFLLYHIAEGIYYGNDLIDGQYLPSAYTDHSVKAGIRVDGCYRRFAEINNSPVYRPDIPARNGVIHVIDWVIRPSDLEWCEGMDLP